MLAVVSEVAAKYSGEAEKASLVVVAGDLLAAIAPAHFAKLPEHARLTGGGHIVRLAKGHAAPGSKPHMTSDIPLAPGIAPALVG